jgi:hypothetical protein
MAKTYRAYNWATPTTAAPTLVTTGTAVKTMLQLATPATQEITIVEWGVFIDAASTGGVKVELIDTDTVAATVTAHVAAGLTKMNAPADRTSNLTLGTSASGYTATAEGTITTTRLLDMTFLTSQAKEWHQYPLGREPQLQPSKFLRVRVTTAAAVNLGCYIEWEE